MRTRQERGSCKSRYDAFGLEDKKTLSYLADFHADHLPVPVAVPVHHIQKEGIFLLGKHLTLQQGDGWKDGTQVVDKLV